MRELCVKLGYTERKSSEAAAALSRLQVSVDGSFARFAGN